MANESKLNVGHQEFWDKHFEHIGPETIKKLIPEYCSQAMKKLSSYGCKRVLELGSGGGRFSIMLAKNGFSMKAIDFSKNAIKVLNDLATLEGVKVDTEVSSAQNFDPDSEPFDAIICWFILDHMPLHETARIVNNFKKNLSPGKGVLLVSFDGPSDDICSDRFEVLPDGTRCYIKGDFKGLLWRYTSDQEIYKLFQDFEQLEFEKAECGSRIVWLKAR
ncbi:MAG: class I SAM-dependent methyltransferase [Candidatus Wallbacteria bacterium]|nr:class I SAM-dependent methyltransferase [Candidatus Wallbacteria bacterium]